MPFPDAALRHPQRFADGTVNANLVYLRNVVDHPNIEVGDYSYYHDFGEVGDYAARRAPYLYAGAPERLRIGRFCQIAHGACFITASANHPMRGFSTYPFAIFDGGSADLYEAQIDEGSDTVVGNDVWIGHEARILPAVTIGDGAIIGAGAVVSRHVPSYAVVAGNPARVVRMRFDGATVAALLAIRWWDWPVERIGRNLAAIAGADLEALRVAV